MTCAFIEGLEQKWTEEGKAVCVGLDPQAGDIPGMEPGQWSKEALLRFLCDVIDATADIAACFKPNYAFFAQFGEEGRWVLQQVFNHIPGCWTIFDGKRGDIGKTNVGYAKEAFEEYGADAMTVHGYLGQESLKPILEYRDNPGGYKGVIVLARTSNPGASEFQDLMVPGSFAMSWPLYQYVASRVAKCWNTNGNCMVVAGGTYPEEVGRVREVVGPMPLLVPGIGDQGGDLQKTLEKGRYFKEPRMIINSSGGIVYAIRNKKFLERHPEFKGQEHRAAKAARVAAQELDQEIRQFFRRDPE